MLTDNIPQQSIRIRLLRAFTRIGLKDEYFLVLVSILIGGATGVFAHLFFDLIEWVSNQSYGHDGTGGFYSGRVWMIVVLPILGALIVGFITYYFAGEAKGHGVPEVMDAMYRKNGVIRPRVSAAKAITSALTIGSGGSAGTEGPIIQIGAAIGSGIGQFLHIPKKQMSIVVACGVSAGIAAIFNAPIAGVLFALEIFLRDFSFRTFSPVVFASVISCSIMHALRLEDVAIFEVSMLRGMGYVFVGVELPLFLMLGVMCGLAAAAFIKLLYFSEDITEKLKIPEPLKPALGAAVLGLIGLVTLISSQTDQVPLFYGNGYPAIQTILGGDLFIKMSASGLIVLFVLKMLATCLTLGSGGSGGVFAPSLLMGAALGGAFGMALAQWNVIPVSSA